MSLKERFEEYKPQPDGQVWQSIEKTMHRKVVMHRAIGISAATVAVAAVAAGVLFWTQRPDESIADQPVVAQEIAIQEQSTTATTVSVEAEETTVVPTVATAVATPRATMPAPTPAATATVAEETPAAPAELSGAIEKAAPARPVVTIASQASAPAIMPASPEPIAAEPEKEQGGTTKTENVAANAPNNANTPEITTSDELVVWLPNAFAPDYPDPAVQLFKVTPKDDANIRSFDLFIYNRAGRQVFHTKDYNEGWDGTCNGHKQPSGAYVYIIQINDINKGLQHFKGTLTLIR